MITPFVLDKSYRNANCYCGCGNYCWLVVVGSELKTRLTIILYFLLVFFQKGPTRIDVLLINVLASALFYSRCKVSDILFEPLPLALGHGADRTFSFFLIFRGTQREYSSKAIKQSIVKRILVFKR